MISVFKLIYVLLNGFQLLTVLILFLHTSSLVLDKSVFPVGSVINAVVSQVMILLRERGLQLIRDIPEEIKEISVYGDQFRIQQVLADFLLNMVRCAPSENGWVEIQVRPNLKQNPDGTETVLLLFRCAKLFTQPLKCRLALFAVFIPIDDLLAEQLVYVVFRSLHPIILLY